MATPKKKVVKATKKQDTRAAVLRTEQVPLKTLQVYHKNPRIGNVDKIAKSLHINGQYRPIVVNVGTHTGRENEILAGNHTYLAARKPVFWQSHGETYDKPAYDTILASFIDVDDDQAAQIVLADNKTADDGTYDEDLIAELVKDIPEINLSGTGYDDKEVESILAKFDVPEDIAGLDDELDDYMDEQEKGSRPPKFDDTDLGDEDEADDGPSVKSRAATKDDEDEDDPEGAGIEITKVTDEIKGAYDLKDDAYFDGVGYFNIPRLRKDMLMTPEELPDGLTTWAGSATRNDDDPDTWWLYNYGVDSTSGMKDVSKVIVGFYTYDEYFEPWWFGPAKYVAKLVNSNIKYALTPDFSDDTNHGRGFCIWQLFRARWLGRYFQEAGLKIIPNISWPDGDIEYLKDFTLATLPKNVPLIAMQLQTYGKDLEDDHKDRIAAELQLVMDTIKPQMLLLYSGQPGYEFFMDRVKTDADVKFLLNRQAKLSISRKGRTKKNTI